MSLGPPRRVGLDFGTTNSVAALTDAGTAPPRLMTFDSPGGSTDVFRSTLCFSQDDAIRVGLAVAAGPAVIHEYLEYPDGSRFLQSFKSAAASPLFESAPVFAPRYRFEELGRLFLEQLAAQAGGQLDRLDRAVVGRPVHYAGAPADGPPSGKVNERRESGEGRATLSDRIWVHAEVLVANR